MNLFQSQDDVNAQKENLIEEVEARMKQNIHNKKLFTIKWGIK